MLGIIVFNIVHELSKLRPEKNPSRGSQLFFKDILEFSIREGDLDIEHDCFVCLRRGSPQGSTAVHHGGTAFLGANTVFSLHPLELGVTKKFGIFLM